MALPTTVHINRSDVRGLLESRLSTMLDGTGITYIRPGHLPGDEDNIGDAATEQGPTARLLPVDLVPLTERTPGDTAIMTLVAAIEVLCPARTAAGAPAHAYALESALTTVARIMGPASINDASTSTLIQLFEPETTDDREPSSETGARSGAVIARGTVQRSTATGTYTAPDGEPLV